MDAPVQQQHGVEELPVVDVGNPSARRGHGVHHLQPRRPGIIIAAQSVHGGNGVGTPAEVAGARPAGSLPALEESFAESDRFVPVTRQRGDHQQPRRGQVALLLMERQIADTLTEDSGAGKIPRGSRTFGCHDVGIGELEAGQGGDRN